MSPSAQTNADLVRLEHASGQKLEETLEVLLDRGEALDKTAEIVERKMESGVYIPNARLAELIGLTKAGSLYLRARSQLCKDNWALLTLYKNHYPYPEVERLLCERLYEMASNDAEPQRGYIVDAMRDVASVVVLPTLESILYDHAPSLKAKQVIAQAIDFVGVSSLEGFLVIKEADSRKRFIESVMAAVMAVKKRVSEANELITDNLKPAFSAQSKTGELQNAVAAREQAQRYLEKDPIVTVMCVRRGAEALGKHLYRFLGHERKGKPARAMTLEELLKPVGDSDVPEVLKHCLRTLQLFGNFAAHDQDAQCRYLTESIARALLAIYDNAMSIYLEWLERKSPCPE